jgi:PAS domain S-box-containing protein
MRLQRADGEYRWFLVLTKPLRDEQGNIVEWYGVSIDIEDRKQAEEKLQHSKVQLAQAQRLAHIGSWDWDLRTNAVTWSDELYHIFGLQPGTINVAGEVDRFIHPDDLDLGWDTVKRAVASKEPYDYYHRIIRPDGTERIARSRGSIMSDERGEPIKVFGATQDVTELRHAEEKLKATTEQLRALSANLQSAREEESKRIAREIHDELGGALTSWRWDLEEIRDTISEPLDSSQVAALQTKIEAMIKLTTTTLDIVRRLSSELRPMALDELGLVEAIEWQALQFQTRTGIAVEYEYSQEKVDLNSEQSTAVFRILQEALTNVLRHAQATKVTITMKQESGEFFLAIKDNGRGIAESEKSGAHSLGLLGMRERAHLIGAQIDITGIEGKGTAVSVRIPISESSERQKKSLRADNDS